MINKLAKSIVKFLIYKGTITEEKEELYIYGLFLFISMTMFFALALILGAIMGILAESALFLGFFSILRMFSGGYHTNKEWTCEVSSTAAIFLVISAMKFLKSHSVNLTLSLLISIIAVFIIVVQSPMESENKRLSEKENKIFRNITAVLAISMLTVLIVAQIAGHDFIWIPIFITFVYQSILLIAASLQKRIKKARA